MEYSWDIDKLIQHRKILKKLLRDDNIIDKWRVYSEIGSIDNMLAFKGHKNLKHILNIFTNPKFVDSDKYFPEYSYYTFMNIPEDIKKIILDSKNIWFDSNNDEDLDLEENDLTESDIVDMSYDFIKSLPTDSKFYRNYFDKLITSKHDLINFEESNPLNLNSGVTFPISHPYYLPYINVNRVHTIMDFLTFIHEYAHAAFFYKKIDSNFLVCEVEGFYFEMLAIEYLNNIGYDYNTIRSLNLDMFSVQYTNLLNLYLTELASKMIDRGKKIAVDSIIIDGVSDLLDLNINEETLVYALANNPKNNLKYLFSYLTFLDLEDIYKNDKERSFKLLEKIRMVACNRNLVNELRKNDISFFDDGYKTLQKTVDKINKY